MKLWVSFLFSEILKVYYFMKLYFFSSRWFLLIVIKLKVYTPLSSVFSNFSFHLIDKSFFNILLNDIFLEVYWASSQTNTTLIIFRCYTRVLDTNRFYLESVSLNIKDRHSFFFQSNKFPLILQIELYFHLFSRFLFLFENIFFNYRSQYFHR